MADDLVPEFAQDSIVILYPGMFTDEEIAAAEDIGAFWVKAFPLGYVGQRELWVINGKPTYARLAVPDNPVCIKCSRQLNPDWEHGGHDAGCERIGVKR